jgi:signal transduction histidine kinase
MSSQFVIKRKSAVYVALVSFLIAVAILNVAFERYNLERFRALQARISVSGNIAYLISEISSILGEYERCCLGDVPLEQKSQIKARLLSNIKLVKQRTSEDEPQQKAIDITIERILSFIDNQDDVSKNSISSEIFESLNRIALQEHDLRLEQTQQLKSIFKRSSFYLWISFFVSLIAILGVAFAVRQLIKADIRKKESIERANVELEKAVNARTAELSIYTQELARSNRELEDFAFIASHDLQEPLRKIQTFSDRLESQFGDVLPDRGRDYLKRMTSASSRMRNLINDILTFSRIQQADKELHLISLKDVITEVVNDITETFEDVPTQINVNVDAFIVADASLLHQLFSNLLSNALKFSANVADPVISVTCYPSQKPDSVEYTNESEWVVIRVTDNGIGFDAEHVEKIFMPFQRLHSKQSYSGTGIGLSICRRVAEHHGGCIRADSSPGQGATFSVFLPVDGPQRLVTKDVSSD